MSPTGPKLAGKHGLALLSFGSASKIGFDRLAETWDIIASQTAISGKSVSREEWALCGYMHVAETEKQAREEVKYQIRDFFDYHHTVAPPFLHDIESLTHDELIDSLNDSGAGVVGTPAMAIKHIERLIDRTGGFGTFLALGVDWAKREDALRSHEFFAREVMPAFDGSIPSRAASFARAKQRQESDSQIRDVGREKATASYYESNTPADPR